VVGFELWVDVGARGLCGSESGSKSQVWYDFKMLNDKNESTGPAVVVPVAHDSVEGVFEKMKVAAAVLVTDPASGRSLSVLCREVGGNKSVLLLDPQNDRSTAEALNLSAFARRFKSVLLTTKST
jgi:hypothetical protein